MRVLNVLLMALVAGLTLQAGIARAQVPPTRFYGELLIDGVAAPAGTEIKAWINDVECGAAFTMEDGRYVIDAAHMATVEGCGVDDVEVVFYINGAAANERGMFTQGSFKELNLTADSGTLPPPEQPPAEPAPEEPPAQEPPPEEPPAEEPPPEG
jgi:hypothetical protein